jgi:arabinofuranosyltransferase
VDGRHKIWLLPLIVLALLIAGLYFYHYVPDDTFITLRYARNVARGDGFVFNTGVRLEGYTNFLWLIILAAAGRVGLPLLGTARALSLVFSLSVLGITFSLSRDSIRRAGLEGWDEGIAAALPPMLLAVSAPFLAWSLSGSEIPLYTTLLLLGFKLLRDGRSDTAVFALFGLLGLVRPDGLLFYAVAGIILLRRGENRRGIILRGAAVWLLLFGPYLIWKWLYFGSLVPNTFYAKTGPPGLMLSNGAKYVGAFLASYGYLIVLGALLMKGSFPKRGLTVLALPFILAHWAVLLLLGGDWMPHFRLLLPTLPLVLMIMNEGLITAVSQRKTETAEANRGGSLPLVAMVLVVFVMFPGGLRYERFENERFAVHLFSRLGRSLSTMLTPETSLGLGSTGAIGYYTDMEIVDILGLTEEHIARRGRIVATQPGHMKTDGAYVLERKPDLLLLGNVRIHKGRRSVEEMHLKVQEEDIAVQPAFARDYEYVNILLGNQYYLSCFKRKDYFLPMFER